ncbi:MAG TPA: ATP-binding cassette domain-containing protein [Thermoplasmata archaeon]|nr:ATP-binding cassette domain-containing protein [Thermoplasmata archaeon]
MAAALPSPVPIAHADTADSEPMIEVEGLVKVYGGTKRDASSVRAVDGIGFHVGAGEFFGFLGPNGSGKTTTIKVLTTLLQPTQGRIRVRGYDVVREAPKVRQILGYAGQSIGVDGDLTGRENLRLVGHLYHLPKTVVRDRVEELLDVLQLTEAADRPANTYSGGMRRRLDLGSGLVHHPPLLFLDEPTTGLDPQTRNGVWEYLRKLHREERTTIFLTTQYMEEADQLCERIAIMDHGRIVATGSPRELKAAIGADLVTIRLPQDAQFEATRARALLLARSVPGVEGAVEFEHGVTMRARNGGATLVEVLRRLESEQILANEVAVSPPTLDQVFLQHTGREMQVEEVRPASRTHWSSGRRNGR